VGNWRGYVLMLSVKLQGHVLSAASGLLFGVGGLCVAACLPYSSIC
jgi:hypothetical protein